MNIITQAWPISTDEIVAGLESGELVAMVHTEPDGSQHVVISEANIYADEMERTFPTNNG